MVMDPPAPESQANLRILVVDDEEDIRTSLEQLLRFGLDGVDVDTAADGSLGVEALRGAHYDLIICDFKMPGMDGIEMLQHAAQIAADTPRIMVTAFPDLDLAIRAINDADIDNFFTKPLDPEKILKVVEETLATRQQSTLRKKALARALEAARLGGRA